MGCASSQEVSCPAKAPAQPAVPNVAGHSFAASLQALQLDKQATKQEKTEKTLKDDFKPIEHFVEPRLSFKSMDKDSDGHGLPALKTHTGYVEEFQKSLKNISSNPEDFEKRVRCGRARQAMQ
ncbi:unnamed protein product [Symbiodinium microadriaticum]|nr:unnamed protein product [Symbiodinium microadriaticum]